MFKVEKKLPELPFSKKALTPLISEKTFDYHYEKHHAAYVKKLNQIIKNTSLEERVLEDIILSSHQNNEVVLFNNAAQHWNHSFFWHCLSPDGGGAPDGNIRDMIIRDFKSIENFKEQFSDMAAKLFGAGWAWLAQNKSGKLEILAMSNAQTPLTENKTPILTLDVWEHAYYIDYRNARPKFIESFWDIINWEFANKNLIV